MGRLDSKVAPITGSARGLGWALAEQLGPEGAELVVADVFQNEAATTARELGKNAHAIRLDVTGQFRRPVSCGAAWPSRRGRGAR